MSSSRSDQGVPVRRRIPTDPVTRAILRSRPVVPAPLSAGGRP
jgi:hypothetical protein